MAMSITLWKLDPQEQYHIMKNYFFHGTTENQSPHSEWESERHFWTKDVDTKINKELLDLTESNKHADFNEWDYESVNDPNENNILTAAKWFSSYEDVSSVHGICDMRTGLNYQKLLEKLKIGDTSDKSVIELIKEKFLQQQDTMITVK